MNGPSDPLNHSRTKDNTPKHARSKPTAGAGLIRWADSPPKRLRFGSGKARHEAAWFSDRLPDPPVMPAAPAPLAGFCAAVDQAVASIESIARKRFNVIYNQIVTRLT